MVETEDNPAIEEDVEELDFQVYEKPKRLNKKTGKNAVVSVYLKNIFPTNPIKERYPNTYRQERCHFIVGDIKKVKVACRKGKEILIVVTL